AVGSDLYRGLVHLHQVSHLRPHPDRAGGPLEDAGLLRFQGARCVNRLGDAAGLLVLLEECAEPGIRHPAQGRDGVSLHRLLVSLHRRSRPQQHPRVWIMSMPTATTTAAASTSAVSSKVRTFAMAFAIAGCVMYVICMMFNLPLVTYHPAMNR